MTANPPGFGPLLRGHRVAAGLTQEQLAERAGMSAHGVSNLERGVRRLPYRHTLLQLVDALRLSGAERAAFEGAGRASEVPVPHADELPVPEPMLVTHPTNLPDEPAPFIGREREIHEIAGLLRRPDVRMVTLTGPGGTGKTRLSLRVGSTLLHDFRDGVFFVSLASITDPDLVPAAIAAAMGVTEEVNRPILDTVVRRLEDKQLLLVLDNFEHVLGARSVVVRLLDTCRELHVLITSRIPLHLSREHEHSVPPLSVPGPEHLTTVETLARYESVALFTQRARAVNDSFAVTHDNAPAVAEICNRLDGLPLAIELAAARTKLFPPQALLQRLSNRLNLLTGGPSDRPARQQTIRGTIDWSYTLLTHEEQTLFARLSVFAGGCTFEAAEAVCNPEGDLDLLEGMTSQVDKSMLRQKGVHEPQFVMLETVREYAREKLAERGEERKGRDWHLTFFRDLAEAANREIHGPDQLPWCLRLETERDNLRAALDWAMESGRVEDGMRLAGALSWFWYARGHWSEARERLTLLLSYPVADTATKTVARATALYGAGLLAGMQGDIDIAEPLMREAIALGAELGEGGAHVQARACAVLAYLLQQHGRREVDRLSEEGLRVARASGDRWAEGIAHTAAGMHAQSAGQLDAARRHHEEALAIFRELGDTLFVSAELSNLGNVAWQQGDFATARAQIEESLAMARAIGMKRDLAEALLNLGRIPLEQGEMDESIIALGEEALTLSREIGARELTVGALQQLGNADLRRGDVNCARARYEDGLKLARATGRRRDIANLLGDLARCAYRQNDLDRARTQSEEGLELARTQDSGAVLAFAFQTRGCVAREEGEYGLAENVFQTALRLSCQTGEPSTQLSILGDIALLAASTGEGERAARLLGMEAGRRAEWGLPLDEWDGEAREMAVRQSQVTGDVAAWQGAWEQGQAMSVAKAVAYAMRESR